MRKNKYCITIKMLLLAFLLQSLTLAGTQLSTQIYDSGSNVGIGEGNPSAKLSVTGENADVFQPLNITNSGQNTLRLYQYGSSNALNDWNIFDVAGSEQKIGFRIADDNTKFFGMNNEGYLGIGLMDPTARLDVNGVISARYTGYNYLLKGVNGSTDFMVIQSGTAAGQGSDRTAWIQHERLSSSAHNWNFYGHNDGTNTQFNIMSLCYSDGDGKVGIGTSRPTQKLEVNGDTKITNGSLTVSGANERIYFNDYRALEGDTDGTNLDLGEGYHTTRLRTTAGVGLTLDGSNVGIGTSTMASGYKLTVNGGIYTTALRIRETIADYVFEKGYKLLSLPELEKFIKAKKHLPGIDSQAEVTAAGGVDMGKLQVKMLEKIEELTLHIIEQDKRIRKAEARISELESRR